MNQERARTPDAEPRLFRTNLTDGTELAFPIPRILRISEAAEFLRVKDNTVATWIKKGLLKAISLPGATERKGSHRIPAHWLLEALGGNYDLTEDLVHYLDALDAEKAEISTPAETDIS
jgi:excisionase family DNA binding protein